MKPTLLALICASLLQAELLRDTSISGEEVVIDTDTGLMWQDDATAKTKRVTWVNAIDHCENQLGSSGNFAGYSDWRLPNINELLTLLDETQSSAPLIRPPFSSDTTASDYYWSATTYAPDTDRARRVYFGYGHSSYYAKAGSYYVRCVRAGE